MQNHHKLFAIDIKDNAIIICENDYKGCLLEKFSVIIIL